MLRSLICICSHQSPEDSRLSVPPKELELRAKLGQTAGKRLESCDQIWGQLPYGEEDAPVIQGLSTEGNFTSFPKQQK